MISLNRDFTNKINWILDNLIPPIIRDSRIFMEPLFWMLFGSKRQYFMSFKDKSCYLDEDGFTEYYKLLSDVHITRDTDLNKECISKIMESVVGNSVLDIACGRGALSIMMLESLKLDVTAVDIQIPEALRNHPDITFSEGNIQGIGFPDNFFHTVVCSHTLEHVQHLETAINELRRVTSRRLIIIVPRQREYSYTFDLHLHFFPYPFSLKRIMGNENAYVTTIGNDLFYMEDY